MVVTKQVARRQGVVTRSKKAALAKPVPQRRQKTKIQTVKEIKPNQKQEDKPYSRRRTRSQAKSESTQESETQDLDVPLVHQVFMNIYKFQDYEVVGDYSTYFVKFEIQYRNGNKVPIGLPNTNPVLNKYKQWQIYQSVFVA